MAINKFQRSRMTFDLSAKVSHIGVPSMYMTSVSYADPCLVPLSNLCAIDLSLEYLFLEKKNILLCPCKKAVTWSCKIEISYMS